ncbi:MAG TPA: hypothetical protein PKL92_05680 [Aquaticitalea sp.]|nr:hypothetical protein [Aquaticitalea sp.]HNU58700.1 hypothetical protein [Aquaticitalea sp.]
MIPSATLIIFLIIVFVLVFLFVNTIDRRKWLTFTISIVVTPLVYFYGFYPMVNIFSSYHHEKYFDSENWKSSPALRYEMSDDLVATKELIGRTKDDVTLLLGPYEWLSWNDTIHGKDPNMWNYGLGIEPGALNDQKENMCITFRNNKVVDVQLYQAPILEPENDAEK